MEQWFTGKKWSFPSSFSSRIQKDWQKNFAFNISDFILLFYHFKNMHMYLFEDGFWKEITVYIRYFVL